MPEKQTGSPNMPYDLTVYAFAFEKLGSKEQANKVLKYVKSHLAEFQEKYPLGCEDYQLYLCIYTNEIIKRMTKNWAADAADTVVKRYGSVSPGAEKSAPRQPVSVEEPVEYEAAPVVLTTAPESPEPKKKSRKPKKPPKQAPPEPKPEKPKRDSREGFTFFQLLAVLLCAALMVWMLVGLLMALDVVPFYDLGYTWFNQHLLPVF